jgi:EAL domain-containing protein (putative c-di-GMP-specific phosphodiesterase class I)/DNA-binding response OmpR family regulator
MIGPPEAVTAPVLVIDDDATVRTLFALVLREAGLDVMEAETGAAALDLMETAQMSVVVCDVSMPGMSGIEVVKALRRRRETATLPVILVTGTGDRQSVVSGLEAGADDFLTKPVDLDELVARVRAHVRTQTAWSGILQDELAVRSGVVAALGSLTLAGVPEQTAEAVVREISQRTDSDFVSVAQVTDGRRMQEIATFNRQDGVRPGGESFPSGLVDYLLDRIRGGAWVDKVNPIRLAEPTRAFRNAKLDLIATAPIFAGDDLVALLTIGAMADESRSWRGRQAKLLAAAIDYASVVSAVAGSSIARRRQDTALRARLQEILVAREFHTVFQQIVDVETRETVGFEALTRFDDGSPPDVRFAEATRAELGGPLELAAIRMALEQSDRLPIGTYVSINISPQSVIDRGHELRELMTLTARPVIIELTEHVVIDDYRQLQAAIRGLGPNVAVAVDDAGAGFASMRHILELRPSFAKLDISLVRGIDADDLRQALAAGLNYFAMRTGCRLIAEGVETHAEAETLLRLGIELGQGYLYGRPQRLADLGRP